MSLRALCGDASFHLSNKREQGSKERKTNRQIEQTEPMHSKVEVTGKSNGTSMGKATHQGYHFPTLLAS